MLGAGSASFQRLTRDIPEDLTDDTQTTDRASSGERVLKPVNKKPRIVTRTSIYELFEEMKSYYDTIYVEVLIPGNYIHDIARKSSNTTSADTRT